MLQNLIPQGSPIIHLVDLILQLIKSFIRVSHVALVANPTGAHISQDFHKLQRLMMTPSVECKEIIVV